MKLFFALHEKKYNFFCNSYNNIVNFVLIEI